MKEKSMRDMKRRLSRTLHCYKERSLPVTEIAVDWFRQTNPDKLGRLSHDFACDLTRKAPITPCAMMLAMVYLERLKIKNPEFVRQLSSSDLFLLSTLMSSKYMTDEGFDDDIYNEDWADCANMDVKDLNALELEFLKAIDWSLFIKADDFEKVFENMETLVAKKCSQLRGGWFTYTDLTVLTRHFDLLKWVSDTTTKIILTCMIAYVALMTSVTAYLSVRLSTAVSPTDRGQPSGSVSSSVTSTVTMGSDGTHHVGDMDPVLLAALRLDDPAESDDLVAAILRRKAEAAAAVNEGTGGGGPRMTTRDNTTDHDTGGGPRTTANNTLSVAEMKSRLLKSASCVGHHFPHSVSVG